MIDQAKIRSAIRLYLEGIGEDPNREGLLGTPDRVARMCEEVFGGIDRDARDLMGAVFTEKYNDIVLIRDIPFNSMCEHHLMPFEGKAHIAYLPAGKIVGLSKLTRLVNCFAARLQVQERLTQQIAGSLREHLKPRAVGVILTCRHMCMESRGIAVAGEETVTSAMLGDLETNQAQRAEFLSLVA